MISRCQPANEKADRYAKRGIVVCASWRRSYEAFLADVGRKPAGDYTLERIKNDLGYKPGNVRWATRREQANNRENSLRVEYEGKETTVANLARRFELSYYTLRDRLRGGWPLALAVKVRPRIGGHYPGSRPTARPRTKTRRT